MSVATPTIATTGNPGNYPAGLENFSGQVGPIIQQWYGLVTGGNSYTTGGFVLTAALFGLKAIYAVIPGTASNSNTVTWTAAGGLKFFVSTTGAEVASATDLSAVNVPLFVIGA